MATEVVKIKFEADTAGLKSASSDVKVLEDQLKKAGVSAEFMDDALDEVGKTLKAANVDAKTFTKALADSSNNTKSLRSQLAEARNEAVRMSAQFGAFSKEAREAAKRAAEIKDQIGDLNDTLDALNPEAKLNAFVKLGQGIQGGFQAATGALQVFGVENERITKLAQQFQGVLNLTQGINSVLQLKDVYGQLRLVLGLTTAATQGATAAATGFGLALSATGIGAIVVALGALAFAFYKLEESIDDAAEASEALKKKWDDIEAARKVFDETFNKLLDERIDKLDFEIKKAEARGATEKELLALQIERSKVIDAALGKAIATGAATIEAEDQLIKRREKNSQELELQQIRLARILDEERKIKAVLDDQAKNKFDKAKILPPPAEVKRQTQEALDVIGTTIDAKASDLPPLPFFTPDEQRQRLQELRQWVDASAQIIGGLFDISNAYAEQEIDFANQQRERGVLSEEQYAAKVKKIKQKQAEENKKAALFQATLNAASAIINALTVQPANAVPAAVALASVLGALNIARIVATPVPKFKQGTLNVGGGDLDADGGMHAIIHKGEAVIPKDRNQAYHPTIAAIFHKRISPAEINSFVDMKLKGKIPTNIDARINRSDLRTLRPVDTVSIKNTGALASQFARELSKYNDLRRI